MATDGQYFKFFRWGSPYYLTGEGSFNDLWMVESLKHIDVTREQILKEAFMIMYHSNGGFNYQAIINLNFKCYHVLRKEAEKINQYIKDHATGEE
jgi:hypothetical protein